jgi:hypothetical protein
MDSKVKTSWVDALRSGHYKKCQYQLKDLDGYYDATGVLCDLAVQAGVIPAPVKQDDPDKHVFFGYVYGDGTTKGRMAAGLPAPVCEWSGLEYRTGYKVAMMGDKGMSFNKLADWIEENI